jgi:hypothetical protein
MCKKKDAGPDEKNRVVKTDTPQQNVPDLMRRHNTPPIAKPKDSARTTLLNPDSSRELKHRQSDDSTV